MLTALLAGCLLAGAYAQNAEEAGATLDAPRNEYAYRYLKDLDSNQPSLLIKAGLGLAASKDPTTWSIGVGVNLKKKGKASLVVEGFSREVYDPNWDYDEYVRYAIALLCYDYLLWQSQGRNSRPSIVYINGALGAGYPDSSDPGFCARIGCSFYQNLFSGLGVEASVKSYYYIGDYGQFIMPAVTLGLTWQ